MDFISPLSAIITIVSTIFIIGAAATFAKLYQRASKEQCYVRTGLRGEKVIMDGGAIVLPVFHQLTTVNLTTMKLIVDRRQNTSLITKDKLRVDVTAEFFIRVGNRKEDVSAAAKSLGTKTMNPEELRELIEGKFVDALRSVAAQLTMEELHEKRREFSAIVLDALQADLSKNGLELENVSLSHLDQTSIEYFNEKNQFDAEGLTILTEQTEMRRKDRNDIEQNTRVAIENKKAEADKATLTINRELEMARISQQKELDEQRAKTEAEVSITRAEQQRVAEEAVIEKDRALEEAEIKKKQQLELTDQERAIAIAGKSREEAAARVLADKARAEAAKASEEVETERQNEIARRSKSVAIIKAAEEAEKSAVAIRVAAEVEKAAAIDRAEAIKISTEAEVDRRIKIANADKATGYAQAESLKVMNAAENSLSQEAMILRERLALIERLPAIISESVKPIGNIDSIRIVDATGINGGSATGNGESASANGIDGIFNNALKYRAQAPMVDAIIESLGVGENLTELVSRGVSMDHKTAPLNAKRSAAARTSTND